MTRMERQDSNKEVEVETRSQDSEDLVASEAEVEEVVVLPLLKQMTFSEISSVVVIRLRTFSKMILECMDLEDKE